MITRNIQLLIIDPQNDFCDIPEAESPLLRPALPVAGGNADMQRLASMVEAGTHLFDAIHVTLDSHHPVDIAHPRWWANEAHESPAPFTVITAADIDSGKWQSRDPQLQQASADYVRALESNSRYALVVWPEHCLIGSWGHNVHAQLKLALDGWARSNRAQVNYVLKGMNPRSEHYSAIRAEVPDPADPATQTNGALIDTLRCADEIVIAGEALSHCVANTVRDLAASLGDGSVSKLVLLTDGTSPVGGFEQLGEDFLDEFTFRGMRTATTQTLSL